MVIGLGESETRNDAWSESLVKVEWSRSVPECNADKAGPCHNRLCHCAHGMALARRFYAGQLLNWLVDERTACIPEL